MVSIELKKKLKIKLRYHSSFISYQRYIDILIKENKYTIIEVIFKRN